MTLYRQGKVPGSFYDGFGQEAVSAGATWAMAAAGPPVHPAPRPRRPHHPRRRAVADLRPVHGPRGRHHPRPRRQRALRRPHEGCVGMVSMLPDMMLIATGMAMAFKLRGEQRCAITWFGDGSTSRGDFHEAMNWAGVQKLPVIFVLENNQYAYSTPLDQQFAVNPVERAAAYGFPGVSADGNDPEAMFEAIRDRARARARRRGPDADRGRDHAHARPRRARRHEVRARPTKVEEWRAQGPDRPPGQAPRGARGRHRRRSATTSRPRSTRPSRRRCSRRCPTATPCSDGLFADEPALLEDGNAPWSRLQGA